MAIDWNFLFDVKIDELSDEGIESLYEQLIQFEPKNEDNIQRLRKLLEVSQSVLQIKSVQAEVAIEEMKETAKKSDKSQIELLSKELEIYKKSDSNGENLGFKLSEANDMINDLKNTIEVKDSENIKIKRKVIDLQNSLDLRDREVIALRSEVDSLKDEIDNQRQSSDNTNEKQEVLEKFKEKNKQIQTLLDELRDAEVVNLELTNQCKKLKLELRNATNELEISCNQMEMLSKQMNQLKQLNEDFISEKQFLTDEIHKLKLNLDKYENGDQNLIDKYVDNLKDLQNLIQLKDEEIIKLKTSSLIPDKEVIEKQKRMSKEVEERDKQIELLKSQLNEAVVDMENQTEIIRKLYHQNRDDKEVSKLNDQIIVLNNQIKRLEEEVLAKDEELLAIRKRINTYERGEYGLKDALKEINDLTKYLNNRDQRIEEMVQQMNKLKQELNDAEDIIDDIHVNKQPNKQTAKDSDLETDKQKSDSDDRKVSSKKDKIKILEMDRKILELEDQKFALTQRLSLSLNKSVVDNQDYKEIRNLKETLKSFERENHELQIGMKEILIGIRETDSQSEVSIECPTLERLCKLLESRAIASDLTNLIALKAELDLVRGHNEQLRADMRSMRTDYLKVIAQYTQDLLESDIIFEVPNQQSLPLNYSENIPNSLRVFNKTKNEEIGDNYEKIGTEDNQTNQLKAKNNTNEELRALIISVERETQTISRDDLDQYIDAKIVNTVNSWTQTETIKEESDTIPEECQIIGERPRNVCQNCPKMMKIVDFLKNCVEKLEQNIRFSENKYFQRLELLQNENKNLIQNFNTKLNEKEIQLNEKESQINLLQNKLTNNQITTKTSTEDNTIAKEENKALVTLSVANKTQNNSDSKNELSSSCKTVLESVINCLQARLEHKDESIRQYRNMLAEAKQNFEIEMIRLIDNIRDNERKNSINFKQMIDNEELESALKNCVNELELCKTESNAKISQLENELEAKSAKLMAFQTENEELKLKRMTPTNQLKQAIDELKEELKQKDSVINSLSKTIKDDRAMRAVSAIRKKDENRDKKVDNELFQEIANLRSVTESQKKTINNLEIVKWDLEKNLKDTKEQIKTKLKEKDNEINDLKEKLEKIRIRFNKNENEKQVLQNKVFRRENIQKADKSIQISSQTLENELTKLKNELKKSQKDLKQRESEANGLKTQLDLCRQIETELKTLLQESLKREKLATIYEESSQMDQQFEQILQENARIKVELRMAEFELKKRSIHSVQT